jgi:hypothetical protein
MEIEVGEQHLPLVGDHRRIGPRRRGQLGGELVIG